MLAINARYALRGVRRALVYAAGAALKLASVIRAMLVLGARRSCGSPSTDGQGSRQRRSRADRRRFFGFVCIRAPRFDAERIRLTAGCCALIVPTHAQSTAKHEGAACRQPLRNFTRSNTIDQHHPTSRSVDFELKVRCSTS